MVMFSWRKRPNAVCLRGGNRVSRDQFQPSTRIFPNQAKFSPSGAAGVLSLRSVRLYSFAPTNESELAWKFSSAVIIVPQGCAEQL